MRNSNRTNDFAGGFSGNEGKALISNDFAGLRNDDVFVSNEVRNFADVTGLPCRKGLDKVIISGGSIVNVVSSSYGHLPNEVFFANVENMLLDANISTVTRSINRENRSFAVDHILNDNSLAITIKNGMDEIRPMLRFTNSYDGSTKTSGHFGFFRKVCNNGLHVAHSVIGFNVKHRGDIAEIVMPNIQELIGKFMSNEFYELRRKFEVLAEKQIANVEDFVELTCKELELFMYASSEKNPAPSLNARTVIDIIGRESRMLNERPNLWIGYNAFNEVIHDKLKKTFQNQKETDVKLFNYALSLAGN